MLTLAVVGKIILFGHDEKKPVTGIRYYLFRTVLYFFLKLVMWSSCKQLFVLHPKPEVSYKKYLGPDWEADYDKKLCGGIVMNHSCFLDSAVHCFY